jgi:hypothetical protein
MFDIKIGLNGLLVSACGRKQQILNSERRENARKLRLP